MSTGDTTQPAAGGIPGLRHSVDARGRSLLSFAGDVASRNVSGWLKYDMPILRAKLADVRAGVGNLKFGVIADSHNQGAGAGSGGTYNWNDAFRFTASAIASKILRSSGIPSCHSSFLGKRGLGITYPAFDPQMVQTGTWGWASSGSDFVGKGAFNSAQVGATMVYTPDQAWDTAIIYTGRNTGHTGAATASATGAANVSLGFTGAAGIVASTLTKASADLNPMTITIDTAMSAYAGIIGARFFNSKAPAVEVLNFAISGGKIADHLSATTAYSQWPFIQLIAPDVIFLELLHNDLKDGTTMAIWLAGIETILSTLRPTTDVICYAGFPGQAATFVTTMPTWIENLRVLLDKYSVNFFDLRTIFGQTFADASGTGLTFDADHFNKRGFGLYGAKLARDILSVQADW